MIWRALAYLVVLLAVFVGMAWLQLYGEGLNLLVLSPASPVMGTSEYSWPEGLQLALLVIIAAAASDAAFALPPQRPVSVLLLALALAALIRECDWFLDVFVADQVWQVLLGLLVSITAVYLLRTRRVLRNALHRLRSSTGLALIAAALAGLFVFSNLIGHEPLWRSLLGTGYVREAKLAAEELSELFCYWLWAVGQSEYWVDCRRRAAWRNR